MNKYSELTEQAQSLLTDENDIIVAMANISSLIYYGITDLNWAGFYRVMDNSLVLGPFQGKIACTRIKTGKGVCGKAFNDNATVVVPNVHEFPGHIACDSASNSEIVIPLRDGNGQVFAVMDIDSTSFDRFGISEKECLEAVAKAVEAVILR